MAPIATWLRETRERQVREDGLPWSQDDLLDRMRAEVDWAPHRPNYSKYETGKATPKPDTLAKFVAFWAARGEPGPDMTPKAEPADLDPYEVMAGLTTALADLTEELREARRERQETARQLEAMQAVLDGLVAPAMRAGAVPAAPPSTTGSGR